MLVSTRSRQANGRNSRSIRQLLAILGLAVLCLVGAQGFSPMAASGACDLGHSIPCEEKKKCRGRLQCSISCSDCYKNNPTDVKGRCHKFPPD